MNRTHRAVSSLVPALAAALLASCGGGGSSTDADATYSVNLRFCSPTRFSSCTSDPGNATATEIPAEVRAVFQETAAKVEGLITAGLVPVSTQRLQCGDDATLRVNLDEKVHGLLILMTLADLPSGVIASSGPCIVRKSSHLPLVAIMEFDRTLISGYQASGQLSEIVFHEMLHTLGFGTTWTDFSPSLISGKGSSAPMFTGAHALQQFTAQNGGAGFSAVPLESCGNTTAAQNACTGTRDSHWENAYFQNAPYGAELMTGYIVGTHMPLSATTLGSLQDLGYSVDLTKAETFSINTSNLRALVSGEGIDLHGDVLQTTVREADDGIAAP